VMNAHGVATLASDKTYQAWAITTNGRSISLGTFRPNSSGNVTMLAKANLTNVTSLGVTVEPAGGSAKPTGQVAAVSL
jgi:anti-sigma-K factor RskA